jgi:hypothetical protein
MGLREVGRWIVLRAMRASLERLLGEGSEFPLEIALSNGDRHVTPHPDYALVHPKTGALVLFPEEGDRFTVAINPDQIVAISPVRKAS